MELINNNQVPEGYKKTEVGVIPEDWETCKLGEAVDFLDEKRKPIKESERAKMRGIYPYYGASGIVDYVNNYLFDEELILLGEDGENILSRNTRLAFRVSGKVWVNNHAHVLKPKIGFDINFLTEYLESLDYSLYNSGTAQPKLNQQICQNIVVVQPLIKEQKAIAQTLSDVDALIASLDKLIAKKRNIKTATMQQLLTGKTRLPGFGGDWLEKQIGTEIDLLTGYPFPSSKYSDSGIRLLRCSNIKRGVTNWDEDLIQYWSELTPDLRQYVLDDGDIVVAMDGSLVGRSFAQLSKLDLPALLLQRVARIRSDKIDTSYLKEWICSVFFTEHCDSIKTVTAIPHISPEDIRNFKIKIPATKEEQRAIAQVLSDIDTEITALEKRRAKTQAIKQGMMQELLTGRTRLKIEHPDDPITKNSNG